MMSSGSRPRLRRTLVFAALVLAAPAAALAQSGAPTAATGAPANANRSNGEEHQPSASVVQRRESAAGISPRGAGQQDRQLDAIGSKLLRETPKSPAGSTMSTGGGTTP